MPNVSRLRVRSPDFIPRFCLSTGFYMATAIDFQALLKQERAKALAALNENSNQPSGSVQTKDVDCAKVLSCH
jgi:Cu/Ag efflux protein CusF